MSSYDAATLQALCDASPFIRHTGLRVIAVDSVNRQTRFRLAWRDDYERGAGTGQWHGGPIAALIDTAGCMALVACAGRNAGTVDFRTDYLRPALGAHLDALASVRRSGRTMGVVDVDVFDAREQLIAVGRGTFFMEAG